jgi:metallophosphoesterase superfamily enzyme
MPLRQRQEIQEVPRGGVVVLACIGHEKPTAEFRENFGLTIETKLPLDLTRRDGDVAVPLL